MRKIFLFLMFLLIVSLNAITVNQLKKMQNSGELIVGKGKAKTESEADKQALSDLTSQIFVEVKSSFTSIAKEDNANVEEYCKTVLETFSNIQLNNAIKFIDPSSTDSNKIIYRYITKEDKNRIFDDRKSEIMSLVSEGEIAEEENNAVDAMRNYYWALMLLKTHPDNKTMTYFFDNKDRLLNTALISKINNILSKTEIKIISTNSQKKSNFYDITLSATYNGVPADGLPVKYNDGYSWTDSELWGDGKGYITIKKSMAKTMNFINLKIDCSFINQGFSGDIKTILATMKSYDFSASNKKIEFVKNPISKKSKAKNYISFSSEITPEKAKILQKVLDSIASKNIYTSRKYFTAKGFRDFNALIGYGNAKILPEKIKLKNFKIGNQSIIRSIPLKFDFGTFHQKFTEKINFIFNEKDKIVGLTFAISDQAIKDIMSKNYATKEQKALIVNFIEQYKTAYCLKDLDFIKKIFSEDALIIVGRVVKKKPDNYTDKLYKQLGNDLVEYIKISKKQFISRLKNQFSKKDFINIHFSDNNIDRIMNRGERVFGIQINQYYYSSDYCDKGYLFLMFDFSNPKEPKILVRSWQPKKSKDGSIVGMDNFQFE